MKDLEKVSFVILLPYDIKINLYIVQFIILCPQATGMDDEVN